MSGDLLLHESVKIAIRNKQTHLVRDRCIIRCDFGKKAVYKTKQPLTKGRVLADGDSPL